jgi:methyl-accepting chemotaxis protein
MAEAISMEHLADFFEVEAGEPRDLTRSLPGNDRLATAVNAVYGAFESLSIDMLKSVTRVSGVMESLDGQVHSLDESISKQGRRVDEAFGIVRRNAEGNLSIAEAAATARSESAAVNAWTSENEAFLSRIASSLDGLGALVLRTESFMTRLVAEMASVESQIAALSDISERLAILAINTAIEAARAGDKGKGFSIIAKEMQKLAKTALGETKVVQDSVSAVRGEVGGMSGSLSASRSSVRDSLGDSASILSRFSEIRRGAQRLDGVLSGQASVIASQQETAKSLLASFAAIGAENERISEMARSAEGLSAGLEEMVCASIEELGKYRTSMHYKALAGLEELAARVASAGGFFLDPDPSLRSQFDRYPWFELLYLMDASGTQVSTNVVNPACASRVTSEGRGKSRKEKPYFAMPARRLASYVSDIYLSAASKRLCLTVSVPLLRGDSSLAGVLAADLDVGDMFKVG